jgi:sugar/nucleoside kinase (ribokinase family)
VSLFRVGGVICCGNTVFDIAVWPVENCEWNTTTWVQTISEGIGGNGANTSYALAVLGVPVSLISVVGQDQPGRRLLDILQSVSVGTSRIRQVTDLSTASTVILVHADGDRKFLHRPGASRSMSLSDISDLRAEKDATHFHFANPFALPLLRENTAEVLLEAKEAGLSTSVDTGWDSRGRWMLDLGPALRYTDLLFVNEAEACLLGGSEELEAAIRAIQDHGVREVVVKTGSRGCCIYSGTNLEAIPAYAAKSIDTTGAGDCFAGAFLAGLAHGWSFRECGAFANAVGAMNVEQIGAITGLRSFDESLAWMRSRTVSA